MIKWPITYTDYNGEEHTEDFYFNLNKVELIEMDLYANGAYREYLEQIVSQRDGQAIVDTYKNIILKAYGEKTPDGRRFIKSEELTKSFEQTEAYVELYMHLLTDSDALNKFIEGILPKMETSRQDVVPASK